MKLSVVVATFNRPVLLERLLLQLGKQTLRADQFEVVVVDDGSRVPARVGLASLELPFRLRVEEQANAGAAAARHRGALVAEGELLLITDDDMQVPEDFLEQHVRLHAESPAPRVVVGRIRPDPSLSAMPLFERWYAHRLEKMAEGFSSGRVKPRGNFLFTGNVSMRRADYLAVGGFDPALKRSEDLELGLKLEKLGATTVFAEHAFTLHGSDHTELATWLQRAYLYGIYDLRIQRKHPDMPHADPWRFMFRLSPAARPLLALAAAAPTVTRPLSSLAWRAVEAADRLGLEKLAFAGSSVVYQMEYFRGVRAEAGSLISTVRDFARYARTRWGAHPG